MPDGSVSSGTGPVLEKTTSPFLLLMMRLWSCGQPRCDALSAQAAPEGVVHKSTSAMPGIALRNAMQWVGRRRVTTSPGVLDGGARNKAECRLDQNAVRAILGQPVRSPINRQPAVRILMHPHRRLDEVCAQSARRQLQAQPLPLYR